MGKEYPIIMSTPMVPPIISGLKTMTRRIIKPQPEHLQYHVYKGKLIYDGEHRMWCYKDMIFENLIDFPGGEDLTRLALQCPYGNVGDVLWVRETYAIENKEFIYKADEGISMPFFNAGQKWKPSIFMPRLACRILLGIKNIKVERLQEISADDISAEAVKYPVSKTENKEFVHPLFKLGEENCAIEFMPDGWEKLNNKQIEEKLLFAHWAELWCKINGRQSWEANPWVWVIEFKKIKA